MCQKNRWGIKKCISHSFSVDIYRDKIVMQLMAYNTILNPYICY